MTASASDCELVSAYAKEGSETAFRGLVARHVDLVYATALRLVGDRGTAEEVVQNVFVALARKAPRLAGIETLAGWLHRTAVLEAKARIRAELRRKRRHEAAAELAAIQDQGVPALDALVPLLDEALLNLRERDRVALVLRFLEDRSLREVGGALGLEEDAARKRVARALDRLTEFFRQRGFAVGGGAAAIMSGAAQAAPAGVASSASTAGLAAGGTTGMNLLIFHLMSLTKTQTAVICAILAAGPLIVQWRATAHMDQEQAILQAGIEAADRTAAELENQIREMRNATMRAQNDTLNLRSRVAGLNAQRNGTAPPVVYHWDDASPVMRVPKQLLAALPVPAVHRDGQLTDQIEEILQLTEPETEQVQGAINRFLDSYYTAQARNMRPVTPSPNDMKGRTPEDTRVFELSAIGEEMGEMRAAFFADLERLVGEDRFKLLRNALSNWMAVEDGYGGMNTGMTIINFDRRERFYRPQPGSPWLSWSFSSPAGHMSMSSVLPLDQIPSIYRPYLQDWIALAQSQPVRLPENGVGQAGGGGTVEMKQ